MMPGCDCSGCKMARSLAAHKAPEIRESMAKTCDDLLGPGSSSRRLGRMDYAAAGCGCPGCRAKRARSTASGFVPFDRALDMLLSEYLNAGMISDGEAAKITKAARNAAYEKYRKMIDGLEYKAAPSDLLRGAGGDGKWYLMDPATADERKARVDAAELRASYVAMGVSLPRGYGASIDIPLDPKELDGGIKSGAAVAMKYEAGRMKALPLPVPEGPEFGDPPKLPPGASVEIVQSGTCSLDGVIKADTVYTLPPGYRPAGVAPLVAVDPGLGEKAVAIVRGGIWKCACGMDWAVGDVCNTCQQRKDKAALPVQNARITARAGNLNCLRCGNQLDVAGFCPGCAPPKVNAAIAATVILGVCECGAEKAKTTHAGWCPKGQKLDELFNAKREGR